MRALAEVKAYADQHKAQVVLTNRARHASELASAALADGCELVVAVGGDGTMNEVATSLIGTSGILGLIPCGSGDGLGRHLRIHGSVRHALHVLETGLPRLIDSGVADGHPFFTAAGMGFEADIALKFNQLKQRGFLRYLSTSARMLRSYQPQRYAVTHADGCTELRAFTLVVANSDQYGNNAIIAPGARADDGQLDLCAIPPITLFNSASLVARLFTGTIDRHAGVVLRRATKFTIERDSAGPLHTDGENYTAGKTVSFSILPASLRIMAPRVAHQAI